MPQLHREMSYETASSSSSRSDIPRPTLPPFLYLTTPQENNSPSDRPGGPQLTIKSFSRAFHHIVLPRRFGTVGRLERVAEATVEDENVVCNTRPSNSVKRKTPGYPVSRLSRLSIVSQSTASYISTPRSPTTLITSFPPLDVSDIPPRSPANGSSFSAVLLAREDEEHEEDESALAFWHTEQLHRARLAKLTRHLGEEIPPEMVLSPTFLSHGTFRSSAHSRRGGYRDKRRSLDLSSFMQESSVTGPTEGILRRSKSLKGQGEIHHTMSVTGTTPEMPSTEYIPDRVRSAETMTNTVAVPNPAPPPSNTPETWHSNSPTDISDSDVLTERVSVETHSDSLLSHSSRPFVETSSEASPFSHCTSRVPPRSWTLPRRPATTDASRRAEKLAKFFGVSQEYVSTVAQAHGTVQELRFLSTSAAGDLAIGIHAQKSQLEVEVKVSKPARFWNRRTRTKSVHPADVMDSLRMMRAS